jgi:membrane protein
LADPSTKKAAKSEGMINMGELTQGKKKTKKRLMDTLKEVYQIWIKERPVQYAAAMAYYAIFSIVPIFYITFLIANKFFEAYSIADQFYTLASEYFGEEVIIYLQEGIAALTETTSGGNTLVSLIGMISIIFSASLIFSQIHYILNKIFQVPPRTREMTGQMIRSRLLTFVILLGVVLVLIMALVINLVISIVASRIQMNFLITVLSFAVLAGLGMLTIALMFKYLSNTDIAWKHIWAGAATAAVLISLLVQLIGIYLGLSKAGSVFQTAGEVTTLLITFYFLGQIFVLGAVFTRVLAAQEAEANNPTNIKKSNI